MPSSSDRRELLADTAIAVLATRGAQGLTHRAVDAAAAVPAGTTSNYFSSRQVLLEAAAHRILDRQRADLERLTERRPVDRAELTEMLAAIVSVGLGHGRVRYLARLELVLEATRNPRLAELIRRVRRAALRTMAELIQSAGLRVADERIDALSSLLNGFILDRIALGVPGIETTALINALLDGMVESKARPGGH